MSRATHACMHALCMNVRQHRSCKLAHPAVDALADQHRQAAVVAPQQLSVSVQRRGPLCCQGLLEQLPAVQGKRAQTGLLRPESNANKAGRA